MIMLGYIYLGMSGQPGFRTASNALFSSSNKMPQQVKQALAECVLSTTKGGGGWATDLNKIVRRLELEGRLFEECWS